MARIRTIKPEFWTDEKIVELSLESRLFFIGLWNFSDEHGNCEGSPKRLKMQIFPGDNFDAESSLIEIRSVGLISDYEVDGKKYIHINNFHKHQKTNTSTAHKFPPPPDEKLADSSDNNALEKEKEKEKERITEKSDSSDYRFTGGTIKLNQADYDKLKTQYPNLDLDYQLNQLDLELKNKKNWFVEMNSKLNYRNQTPAHHRKSGGEVSYL